MISHQRYLQFITIHAELPLSQHSDPSHLYHGNEHHTTCTHTERAIAMASSTMATRSFQRTDQFTQQLTGHSVKPLSIIFLPSSLFPINSSVMSQTNYLLSAGDKVLQCSVQVSLMQVVTAVKRLCRNPRRCPRMQLSRHRTHASTATISTSGSSRSKSEGEGKKYKKSKRGGCSISSRNITS